MLNPDFEEFIESLNVHRVRYLIIGGYAVALALANYIALDDLIAAKAATPASRLQDKADLAVLQRALAAGKRGPRK